MAKQRVVRKALVEDRVQDVDLIDAFAGKDSLAIKVLVGVGDGAGIDVEAGLPGVDGRQARTRGRVDTDADTRLQDAVTLGHDAQAWDR